MFDNSSDDHGGAVLNTQGQVTVVHSTLLGNSARRGGGIFNQTRAAALFEIMAGENDAYHC